MASIKTSFTALLVLIILGLSFSIAYAQQQYRTESKIVTTKIGNPPVVASFCPIPNGEITCGSKNKPINGCGHCGVGYEDYMDNCDYEGINYAMDIKGNDFQDVILPSVNGVQISWTWVDQTHEKLPSEEGGPQAIQRYSGTNTSTGEKFWIQFHHTRPGSGNQGTHTSGERGANICGDGCSPEKHVHVEFAKLDSLSGKPMWQEAPDYFCKA